MSFNTNSLDDDDIADSDNGFIDSSDTRLLDDSDYVSKRDFFML